MDNPTTPSGVPARCQAVNWCAAGAVRKPHGEWHIGDLDTIWYGSYTISMELYRHVNEADHENTMVRINFAQSDKALFFFDMAPDHAVQLAEVIRTLPLQKVPDFVAALRRGRYFLKQERPV